MLLSFHLFFPEGEVIDGGGDEDEDNAARDVRDVVDARRDARDADEEREHPEDGAESLIVERDDHGDRRDEEHVVGRETVVESVRNEWNEMADDEWPGVVVEMRADLRKDIRERSDDDPADDHAFLDLPRLLEEENRGGEKEDEIEVLGTNDNDGVHRVL